MPSKIAKLSVAATAVAVLFSGTPVFAQSQSASGGDPFSGVSAVDSDEMSAVSGELTGRTGIGRSTPIGSKNGAAGAPGASGVASHAITTTTSDISASGSHDFANQGNVYITINNNNGAGNGGLSQ